jgi:hypothetical protein
MHDDKTTSVSKLKLIRIYLTMTEGEEEEE